MFSRPLRACPCLRPRACGRARQARRSSERVFELAARDEPAWLVARRQPAQYALGILYSLAKLSGKVCRARAGRLGRDGALCSTMSTSSPIGSPAAYSSEPHDESRPSPAMKRLCHPPDAALACGLDSHSNAAKRTATARVAALVLRLRRQLEAALLRPQADGLGSPPASPAAGPHSAPLAGGVPRGLWRAACLAQTAADAARGRRRRCCRARCAVGVTIVSSPRRRRHLPLAAALPCPATYY